MPRPAKPEVEEWHPDLSPDEPVTIVGAGLAGLACAIVLVRAGRPVIVREWHKTVGNRFHGDFQGLENWSDGQDVLDELRAAGAIAAGYVFETDRPDGNWIVFNDRLAPLGYAYLLIHAGRGTVANCMFTGFKRQAEHVERMVAFFREKAGLEMRNPKPFGGFANFRLPRTALQGGHPVVGEQAGFQDALAGFGMRYALRSGILAARSLIEGTDYTRLWRQELLPLLRTGASNRFIFNSVGARGRRWALRGMSRSDTAVKLRRLYRPSVLTRLVYPLALWRYRAPLGDPSCDHVTCDCVWCRHGVGHAAPSLA